MDNGGIMQGILILGIALLIDIVCGEAPNRFHPVAWLGNLATLELKLNPVSGRVRQFIFGAIMVIVTASGITLLLYFALQYVQNLNSIAYIIVSAYLLKNTFSLRGLWRAVERVKKELANGNIEQARIRAQALVSRDVNSLDRQQLISASIESCAENLGDSFVAPLLYYAVFGLPGAVCYRIINTYDAMIGYHGRWEYTGKFAARLDDVLNFIPARLSGLFILLASALCKANAGEGWRTMLAQHSVTESPNAGWTMCAMAGALNITLEKKGAYTLGCPGGEIGLGAITKSQTILLTAAAVWGLIILIKEVVFYAAA
jgi:adenosylcobinamide-phosphate synthase